MAVSGTLKDSTGSGLPWGLQHTQPNQQVRYQPGSLFVARGGHKADEPVQDLVPLMQLHCMDNKQQGLCVTRDQLLAISRLQAAHGHSLLHRWCTWAALVSLQSSHELLGCGPTAAAAACIDTYTCCYVYIVSKLHTRMHVLQLAHHVFASWVRPRLHARK
jgi:hypothetical protein